MRPELIVAGKEFRDHLTSKRFIVVLAILLLVAIISMVEGMGQYDQMLETYKKTTMYSQQGWYNDQIASLNKQISEAEARGASASEISSLKYQLDSLVSPEMPSVMFIFTTFNNEYFIMLGMVLAIILGFDLITREREEGSLKSLLSHPVYRDSVINGKLLAVVGVLVTAIGMVFIVMLSIMLFYGVVPTADDLFRIFLYFLLALLYCGVFFAFAIMTSSLSKSSAMSILFVLGIAIVFMVLQQSSDNIAGVIMGPPPEYGKAVSSLISVNSSGSVETISSVDVQKYYKNRQMISDMISTISPTYNFGDKVSDSILSKYNTFYAMQGQGQSVYTSMNAGRPVLDSLASVWVNLLALIMELAIPLAVSYIIFLRVDVR